ncbi:MAG: DNA cytosine methyltransferase [bacterium]
MVKGKYNFIDLFAGCGGFSEGFYQEGFRVLSHVEINKFACETLKERMRYYDYSEEDINNSVLCKDIRDKDIIEKIQEQTEGENVDVLVGGPPCQSFSSVGRAQDPNSMKGDSRNYLFENYINILEYFKPKIFVFENVIGLLSAKPDGERILPRIFKAMKKEYNINEDENDIVLNSVHYGVPQTRKRVIIIGVRKDIDCKAEEIYDKIEKTHYGPKDPEEMKKNLKKYRTVGDAILDLPKLKPSQGEEEIDFKPDNWNEYLDIIRDREFGKLYNHVVRGHNERDRKRYRILSENLWTLKDLDKEHPELVHHDPDHFGNRYTVQRADMPGRTIVAHLYKDGNLFIHPDPDQERTFTVREAARIQSFPDDFRFMTSRTQQFKQVGNAVPPMMAKAIANAIYKTLKSIEKGV